MKRILVLCLLLLCVFPVVSATATWNYIYATGNGDGNFTATKDGVAIDGGYLAGDGSIYNAFNTGGTNATVLWANPNGIYYSNWAEYVNLDTGPMTCNGVTRTRTGHPTSYIYYNISGNGPVLCESGTEFGRWYEFQYENGTPPAPIANFTGSPLAGVYPLNTAFTDTSENEYGGCTYNWSITPTTNVTGNAGVLENHAATFNGVGNYTVSHGVECPAGSNISTKTDYIWVYAPNETETTYFYTYNPLSGYEIRNSNIYLNDIENGSWVNSTGDADGRLGITALSTHHINAYSDKEGFGDGELLNQLASGLSYPLIMFPSNVTNVSAGNVTLYINVIDTWAPGTPVSGATVSITYAWPAIQYGTTNEAGMISFTVPNNTVIQVAANKAGYTGVSDSVNSGAGSGGEASVSKTLYITKKTVTTAPTATTLPGGGTPTPQVTYLPHCDPSAADYDEALCRASKGGVGLNLLADYMDDLILLCIFVTIMYLLGFKLGG